jgi:hypothetical protein
MASGWSPAGGKGWCRRHGLPANSTTLPFSSMISAKTYPLVYLWNPDEILMKAAALNQVLLRALRCNINSP